VLLALAPHTRSLKNSNRGWMVSINRRDDPWIAPQRQSVVEHRDGNLGAVALSPDATNQQKPNLRIIPDNKPAVTDVSANAAQSDCPNVILRLANETLKARRGIDWGEGSADVTAHLRVSVERDESGAIARLIGAKRQSRRIEWRDVHGV
jgi:hypothetical protein